MTDNKERNKEYSSQKWASPVTKCSNCGHESDMNITPKFKNIWGIPIGQSHCHKCVMQREYDLKKRKIWTNGPIEPIEDKDIKYNQVGGFV